MNSKYEMIMDLPLFKGVGKEQVSVFLAKTHLYFENYEAGEVIVSKGDEVTMLRFVIAGEVRISHDLCEGKIKLDEICSHGIVLGADRLYGMTLGYVADVRAYTKCSVMSFSKEQYLRLLHTDSIYLINFFNFLSRRSQRPVEAIGHYTSCCIRSRISLLLKILTDPTSERFIIYSNISDLAGYLSCRPDELRKWVKASESEGLVEYSRGEIIILSRTDFITDN